ncbi:MAG: sulfurtransferase [Betaproteobacteria bacterium]|nr:sulfurtransferase [Betaproteobacteria bacterium]
MQQLAPAELKAWMSDPARTPPGVLDVREPWEYKLCAIEGSQSMPMSRIAQDAAGLDAERDWVVVCHHGMRSFQACMYLQRLGFAKTHNLQGGIDAWARDVEPGMARY